MDGWRPLRSRPATLLGGEFSAGARGCFRPALTFRLDKHEQQREEAMRTAITERATGKTARREPRKGSTTCPPTRGFRPPG